jgi:predicted transposase YbfD/YdcC
MMEDNLLQIFKEEISEQARDEARQYSLPIIMYLSVIAILMGAKNPMDISRWMEANAKRKEIKKLLGVEFFKAPKKSRLYTFFEIVDKEELERAFRRWIRTFIDIPEQAVVGVDGKVIKGSATADKSAVSILSMVLAESKLIIAHKEIENKSNEIPALQKLIGELDETFIYEFDSMNTQTKTLGAIQESGSLFIAPVKGNQPSLVSLVHEVEEASEIASHHYDNINQSGDSIEREVFVYNSFPFPWNGIFIYTVIRIDKSVNGNEWTTQYYISNDMGNSEYFLEKVLQEWSVETMHFYKDCALYEDNCKVHKGAFSLSVLRSIVINILHLNQIKNIARKIVDASCDLAEALSLVSMVKLVYGFVK